MPRTQTRLRGGVHRSLQRKLPTDMFGYRISWAQLAWIGHRASGIGVLVFLFLHIVETATVLAGPQVYDFTQTLYHNLPVKLGEVLLMAALVYHSLNGLRIIAMDFWPSTTIYYRPLTYGIVLATIITMIPLGLIMVKDYAPWS